MERVHKRLTAPIFVAIALLALTVTPSDAATPVTVTVPKAKGASGSAVKVPITVTGASTVGALQLVLTYDAAVLEPQSATRGKLVSDNSSVVTDTKPEAASRLSIWSSQNC